MSNDVQKEQELEQLRARLRQLEGELRAGPRQPAGQWQASGFYTAYYATTGFLLGGVAAMSSLLVNIVGALRLASTPWN